MHSNGTSTRIAVHQTLSPRVRVWLRETRGAVAEGEDDDPVESVRISLAAIQEENSTLKTEVSNLTEQLSKEKDKYKALWKINLFLSEKERELSRLRDRILELECGSIPQGRRHDFEIGGAESEVGRKMCARLRARNFFTTPIST